MARAQTRIELYDLSEATFQKLNELIDKFSHQDQLLEFPKGTMNRNIRDVLGHLYHWQLMFLDWYKAGMSGIKPEMPAKGYKWKDTPLLNKVIHEKYTDTVLNNIRSFLSDTHKKIQSIINQHDDAQLFTKSYYKWTGTTTLGLYIEAATSSHYKWAYNLIQKSMKHVIKA